MIRLPGRIPARPKSTHFDDKEQLLAVLCSEFTETAASGPARDNPIREHVTACWAAMRIHRPTVIALPQSAIAAAPASGRRWHLRDRGEPLPGDPELLAATVGAMLANQVRPNGARADVATTPIPQRRAGFW